MTRSLDSLTVLYAAEDVSALTLTASESTVAETDTDSRTLSGMLLPYGAVGYTSVGEVVVPGPGIIDIPEDLSRVKLVDDHPTIRAIGVMTAARDTPAGLRGAFRVGRTPAGDVALLEASERVRDAFSVELTNLSLDAHGNLTGGRLKAVALVIVPAWADAREDGLAAAHHPHDSTHEEGSTTMTEAQRERLAALLAIPAGDRSDAETGELRELLELANGDAGAETPEDGETPDGETPPARDELAAGHAGTAPRRAAARVPGHVPAGNRRRAPRPLRDLYAAMANAHGGRGNPPELLAALSDITGTANIWTSPDEYGGQLWSGLEYQRRYVPLMLTGRLTSYKGSGWKWTTKPEVGDYAGDKAAVPSNTPVTVATSWTAARLAGAHDIDRKFVDFGDSEFIEAYFAAMRESYAMKSDDKARAFLIANATPAGAAGTGLFRAAATASVAVRDATGGRTPDWFLVNSTDQLGLLDLTAADIPAYLEAFGVTPDKFIPTVGVPAGTVIGGIREASRFRELDGSPIRVEALNVANGGVDGGVFGYYATEETFDGGIASATFI